MVVGIVYSVRENNPFSDTMKRFCLYNQCSHLNLPLDTLPLEVDAQKV